MDPIGSFHAGWYVVWGQPQGILWLPAIFRATRLVGHNRPMRAFGRLLQLIALLAPPLSIVLQLRGTIKANTMLVMLVAAVSLFYLGRLAEGYGTR